MSEIASADLADRDLFVPDLPNVPTHELRRPGAAKPTKFSRQWSQERRALGRFKSLERNQVDGEGLATRRRCRAMRGERLLILRERGQARPFVLGRAEVQLQHDTGRCVTVEEGRARVGLSTGELAVLAWIAAVMIGFRCQGGLATSHAALGQLIPGRGRDGKTAARTIGTYLRRLEAMGLVEHDPFYTPDVRGAGKRVRTPNTYRLSTGVLALVRAELAAEGRVTPVETAVFRDDTPPGSMIQAGESKSPTGTHNRCPPGGDAGGTEQSAPERARARGATAQAMARVLREAAAHQAELEAQLRSEFQRRTVELEGSFVARTARAVAAAGRADVEPNALEREVIACGMAQDREQARRTIALAEAQCPLDRAARGTCCGVHEIRRELGRAQLALDLGSGG